MKYAQENPEEKSRLDGLSCYGGTSCQNPSHTCSKFTMADQVMQAKIIAFYDARGLIDFRDKVANNEICVENCSSGFTGLMGV